MFERYTESARRALFFARYEVTALGGFSIEPEHLLLGLCRSSTPLVKQIFREANIATGALRDEINRRLAANEKVPTSVEIPFSEATKRALHFAAEEADRLLHRQIGTEHLLLALLREEDTGVGALLTGRGLQLAATRTRLAELLNSESPPLTLPDPVTLPDPGEVVNKILYIQSMFEHFARDAVNRGAAAEEAQVILEEFEALKKLLEGGGGP